MIEDVVHEYTIRSPRFALMEASTKCWKCGSKTSVVGVLLPPNHEEMCIEDDPADDEWGEAGISAIVSNLSSVDPHTLRVLLEKVPHLKIARSMFGVDYYANHCQVCQAHQEDHHLHDVGGALLPMDEASINAIGLTVVNETFLVDGSSCWGTVPDMLGARVWPAREG